MIHVVAGIDELAVVSAGLVTDVLKSGAERGTAGLSVALSGGATPRRLYQLLADEPGDAIPWPRVGLFWGDERCVPPEDMKSNYGMVMRTGLLDRPVAGVHRMLGELPPDEGALVVREGAQGVVSRAGIAAPGSRVARAWGPTDISPRCSPALPD